MLDTTYLKAIQGFEGFTARATSDYTQLSNGYGTKALHPGEVVDRAEAEKRFRQEISAAEKQVDTFAPGLDEGTKAALTSLTFNAGSKWMKSGLGSLVRDGDLDGVRRQILDYNKAGGQVLEGLKSRRIAEASWIGAGLEPAEVAAAAPKEAAAHSTAAAMAEPQPQTSQGIDAAPAPFVLAFEGNNFAHLILKSSELLGHRTKERDDDGVTRQSA